MQKLSYMKVFGTILLVAALIVVVFHLIPLLISAPSNVAVLIGAVLLIAIGTGVVVYAYNKIREQTTNKSKDTL